MEPTFLSPPRNTDETLMADTAFDAALAVGQIVEVSWTESTTGKPGKGPIYRFRANARVEKVNRSSVRVKTLEPALHQPAGRTVYAPRWPWSRWPDKGVWPRSTHLVRISNADKTVRSLVRVPDAGLAESVAAAARKAVGSTTLVEIKELP